MILISWIVGLITGGILQEYPLDWWLGFLIGIVEMTLLLRINRGLTLKRQLIYKKD